MDYHSCLENNSVYTLVVYRMLYINNLRKTMSQSNPIVLVKVKTDTLRQTFFFLWEHQPWFGLKSNENKSTQFMFYLCFSYLEFVDGHWKKGKQTARKLQFWIVHLAACAINCDLLRIPVPNQERRK